MQGPLLPTALNLNWQDQISSTGHKHFKLGGGKEKGQDNDLSPDRNCSIINERIQVQQKYF